MNVSKDRSIIIASLVLLLGASWTHATTDGYSFDDYATFVGGENDDSLYFGDANLGSNKEKTEAMTNGDTVKVEKNLLSFPQDVGVDRIAVEPENSRNHEKDRKDFFDSLLMKFKRDSGGFRSEISKISPDNLLLDHLSKFHKLNNQEYSGKQSNDSNNQTSITRQISDSWQTPLDMAETESSPWMQESYYPRDSKYMANYYEDYAYSPSETVLQKNYSKFDFGKATNYNFQQQYPNNYYSDYGISPRRNYKNYEYKDGAEDSTKKRDGVNWKKFISRNSCRQYLEFLRYAFQKLDESPDYRYDYDGDYGDSNEEKFGRSNFPYDVSQQSHRRINLDEWNLKQRTRGKDQQQMFHEANAFRTLSTGVSQINLGESNIGVPPATTLFVQTSPNSVTTQIPWVEVSESHSSTSGQTTKNFVTENYFTTPYSWTTSAPKVYYERKEQKFENSHYKTSTQEFVEKYRTEYQNLEKTTTPVPESTANPRWLFPENYFKNLGSGMSETPSIRPTTETTTTTPNPITYGTTLSKEVTTLTSSKSSTEDSVDEPKKDDSDCDDKVLPCPDMFNITYPLNGYCNKYVSCESGRAIRRTCPEGLHFNILTKSCDLPHNSFCNYACSEADGYYGIPGDCGGYFVCENSFAEYRMCPPKMYWDTKHDICTFVESSSCPMKCSQPNGVVHYEGDCKGYIICLNGIPYYHSCPPNTKFDRSASTCIPEHLSKCSDDPKLMTRMLNLNYLCRDAQMKFGTETWCDYYRSKEKKV